MTKMESNSTNEDFLEQIKRVFINKFDLGGGDIVEVAQDLLTQ
ncbi:MAG: hypothetical protein O7G83_14195 [Proteobacteria bacterium]|nr:hypothetical protein [Pseudomonadota bacterium]